MPLKIVRNDITQMSVDAVVNAANTANTANTALKMGGGVCGAIFSAAGADKL
jgi:O-acetyl-ADP-ribose deacetylase